MDGMDDGSFPTGMVFHPRLPQDYFGGDFRIIDFGCFIIISSPIFAYFSGRNMHGGTPPRAPKGATTVTLDAYRFSVVCYPNQKTVRGTGPTSLGPLAAGDKVLTVPPEIRHRLE